MNFLKMEKRTKNEKEKAENGKMGYFGFLR